MTTYPSERGNIIPNSKVQTNNIQQMLCPEKERMEIKPAKFLRGIGQICPICKSRLKYYQAISVCCCYMFTHEDCFVKTLQPLIQPNRDFVCSRCSHTLKVKAKICYQFEPRLSCSQLFAFIVGLLCVLMMVLLTKLGVYDRILPEAWCLGIAGFSGLILIILLVYTIRKVVITDITITPTELMKQAQKLDIDFSEHPEQGASNMIL